MVLQIDEIIVVVFLFIIIKKKCQNVISQTNRVTHSTQLYYAGKNI